MLFIENIVICLWRVGSLEVYLLCTIGKDLCYRVTRWYMYFRTKNTNLGKCRRVLEWKMLIHIYFMAV
jgi:hypothetical protein